MSDHSPPAAPARAQFRRLSEVKTIGEALTHPEVVSRMTAALPRHMNADRMLRVCTLAVQKVPKLAECDIITLLGAMISLATLGLEPNTPLGHAYLIPFEKRVKRDGKWVSGTVEVQVIIGYRGYIDLARRSGELRALHADVVYEGDEFSFEYGSKMHLMHRPKGARAGRKPLWAYFHATLPDGEAFEVLPYEEILAIRNASQGYQTALRNKNNYPESFAKSPWVAFEHEMAAKTMVRRIAKWLPMSIELADAATIDASHEGGARVDYAAVVKAQAGSAAAMRALTSDEYVPPFDLTGGFTNQYAETEIDGEADPAPVAQQQQRPAPEARVATPDRPARSTPAASKPAPAARRAAPTSEQEPVQQPTAEPAPDPYYLVDAAGDMAGGPYATGAAFVAAYNALYDDTRDNDEREALAHHNADFIAALAEADARALHADLFVDHDAGGGEAAPKALAPVAVPQKSGKPDWVSYTTACLAEIGAIGDVDGLEAWFQCNTSTMDTASRATIGIITAGLSKRRAELLGEPAPAADDPDERRALALIEQVDGCADAHALRALDRTTSFRVPLDRLEETKPTLAERVKARAAERMAEFGGSGQ